MHCLGDRHGERLWPLVSNRLQTGLGHTALVSPVLIDVGVGLIGVILQT